MISNMSKLRRTRMRLNPWGPGRGGRTLGMAVCIYAFAAALSLTGHARQARSVADGVYTAEQAQRGAALYKAQCVACHGEKLEGLVGPMLAGPDFVTAWGGRSIDRKSVV